MKDLETLAKENKNDCKTCRNRIVDPAKDFPVGCDIGDLHMVACKKKNHLYWWDGVKR